MGTENQNLNQYGSGLGLNICKKIVEKFGGDIHLTSKLWFGTQIDFFIECSKMDLKYSTLDFDDLIEDEKSM